MDTNLNQGSATIYQFPVRFRATAGINREDGNAVVDLGAPRLAKAAFGNGWYHDDAVQESEQEAEQVNAR